MILPKLPSFFFFFSCVKDQQRLKSSNIFFLESFKRRKRSVHRKFSGKSWIQTLYTADILLFRSLKAKMIFSIAFSIFPVFLIKVRYKEDICYSTHIVLHNIRFCSDYFLEFYFHFSFLLFPRSVFVHFHINFSLPLALFEFRLIRHTKN